MAGGSGGGAALPARKSKWGSPVPLKRPRIEIIPLIDVMFFLLASFMMVSLSLQKAETFKMDLPVASTAKPDFKPDMLNIGIEKDGRVSVEKRYLTFEELDGILRERLQKNNNTPVYVTADRAALHGQVNRVLERVRGAGVLKVSFVTEAADPGLPAVPAATRQP
jgi:biopolymer transport protein ExbD